MSRIGAKRKAQAAQSSGGPPQPTTGYADAPQLGVEFKIEVRLGCFNSGITQGMLSGKQAVKHRRTFQRVICRGVDEQHLHMVTLCEVGNHREGLGAANLSAQTIVSKVFHNVFAATSEQAYMAMWQAQHVKGDPSSVCLTPVGEPTVVQMTTGEAVCDAQLVIMTFTVDALVAPDHEGLLISGQLHIRTPHATKAPSMNMRKEIAKEALNALDDTARTVGGGTSQSTAPVLVLTGDPNLDLIHAEATVQLPAGHPSVQRQWQVLASGPARRGDLLFFKGATGAKFDVAIGRSYADRGCRNDDHDFFGVALGIPMSSKPPPGPKRQKAAASQKPQPKPALPNIIASGAAQPAVFEEQQQARAVAFTSSSSGAALPPYASERPTDAPVIANSSSSTVAYLAALEEDSKPQPAPPNISTSGAAQPAVPTEPAVKQEAPEAEQDPLYVPEVKQGAPETPNSSSSAVAYPAASEVYPKAKLAPPMISTSGAAQPAVPTEPAVKEEPPEAQQEPLYVPEVKQEAPEAPESPSPAADYDASSEEQDFAPDTPRSTNSAASQLAAVDDTEERRMAKNGFAYPYAAFIAWYSWSKDKAEEEWYDAPVANMTRGGTVTPQAQKIVDDMYDWYNARVDDEQMPDVFRHLHTTLFKKVKVQLKADLWKVEVPGGASQPAVPLEANMVVSKEYVASQVQAVILHRERWLRKEGLEPDLVLRDNWANRFLEETKAEYHASPNQQRQIQRDRNLNMDRKTVRNRMHSRWSRHQQRQGGTAHMWTLLSFTGKFDPKYLADSIAKAQRNQPLRMPGETSPESKQNVIAAQEARSRLRRGEMLERLQLKLAESNRTLHPKQQRVLEQYQRGDLLREANRLTLASGHGRLKRPDGSYVDIGGSTGGFLRVVLDDWMPPDVSEFQ